MKLQRKSQVDINTKDWKAEKQKNKHKGKLERESLEWTEREKNMNMNGEVWQEERDGKTESGHSHTIL